jgi:hypothetical protein
MKLNRNVMKSKILDPAQGAFQSHKSSIDQVGFICQRIQDGFNSKMSTLAVFVDFKAAYDLVSRNILIKKLTANKIEGGIVRAVRDFLCQRFISVKFQDRTSSYKQVRRGLPQGAVSSTFLFNIMINDLCKAIKDVCGVDVILYADDLAILVSGYEMKELQTKMNCALKILHEWTKTNEMEINTEKTNFQTFSLLNITEKPKLKLGESFLNETKSQIYLGVVLDQRLTFKSHAQMISTKAQERLKLLNRLTSTTWGASLHTLITTYKVYILPVLMYGSELMICASNSTNKQSELIQNKALRIMTGAVKTTPITAMEIVTGILPVKLYR